MNLVHVDGAQENQFIGANSAGFAWIGASDQQSANQWTWTDDNSLFWTGSFNGSPSAGKFSSWAFAQPNLFGNCAAIEPLFDSWTAQACNLWNDYICESSGATSAAPQAPAVGCTHATSNGHDYWFCNQPTNGTQARANCRSIGLDLATIDNANENTFVTKNLTSDSFIGLSDSATEGIWKWDADSRLGWCGAQNKPPTSSTYANWEPLAPSVSARCTLQTRSGHDYWFCSDLRTWSQAESACEANGQTLARIDDSGENTFIRTNSLGQVWLGGSDQSSEGSWVWSAGNQLFWSGGPQGSAPGGFFANWLIGEPKLDSLRDCLAQEIDGHWNDHSCSLLHSWVCEGAHTASPQLPDDLDCTRVRTVFGGWSNTTCASQAGYVCETAPPDAGKRLMDVSNEVREDFRSGVPRVSYVEFKPSTQSVEPFLTYGPNFGLRECVDTLEATGAANSLPGSSQEMIRYQQRYLGVNVATAGYRVQRDSTTKVVSSITGHFDPNITVATKPALSQSAALSLAVARAGTKVTDYFPVPVGELVVISATEGFTKDWRLAWRFNLPKITKAGAQTITIDANSGSVIGQVQQLEHACTSVDVSAVQNGTAGQPATIQIEAFQQQKYNDLDTAKVTALGSGYALYQNGTPAIFAQCSPAQFPQVAQTTSAFTIVGASNPDQDFAAMAYMTAQRCLDYFANNFSTADGKAWLGFDGVGAKPIDLRIFDDTDSSVSPAFDPSNFSIVYNTSFQPFLGASTEAMCHELAHGIWHTLVSPNEQVQAFENKVLNEGFADIVANSVEMALPSRGFPGPENGGWCLLGDQFDALSGTGSVGLTCDRDFASPEDSKDLACVTQAASGLLITQRCPREYDSPNYCKFDTQCGNTNVDCCDSHADSTVLSHWFYLLSKGLSDQTAKACPFQVAPLGASVEESSRKAMQLLFKALLSNKLDATSGYEDLAQTTVTLAEQLYPGDSTTPGVVIPSHEALSVSDAWFASNVVRDHLRGVAAAFFVPLRDDTNVSPWVVFVWAAQDQEKSWDFQISTGPFDDTTKIKFTSTDPITTTFASNGFVMGTFSLALPYNSTDRYFWRVRPHSTDPWNDCYPINSFTGTRAQPDDVKNLRVVTRDDGKVEPGTLQAAWDPVQGASTYKLYLSTTADPNCTGTSYDPIPDEPTFANINEVLPETHYYIDIQPIGPIGFDGKKPVGKCIGIQFDTGKMSPPLVTSPPDNQTYVYQSNVPGEPHFPTFAWIGDQVAATATVSFYKRDSTGACTTTVAATKSVQMDGTGSLNEDVFPMPNASGKSPNLYGYCWDVQMRTSNGSVGPKSAQRKFSYYSESRHFTSPGVGYLSFDFNHNPGAIPGDSYGGAVTFKWDPIPGALKYRVFVGTWPVDDHGTPTTVTLDTTTTDTQFAVPADAAGSTPDPTTSVNRGRYCWQMSPLLQDPDNPGTGVDIGSFDSQLISSLFCYTVGPSAPKIDMPTVPAQGFSGARLSAGVTFDYLPDMQYQIFGTFSGSAPEEVKGINCDHTTTTEYQDGFGCNVGFGIIPHEGTTFTLEVKAWNSTTAGTPTNSDADLVQDVKRSITFGTCGAVGESCCDNSACDDPASSQCTSGQCTACGALGEACCGQTCRQGTCTQGTCKDCSPLAAPTNLSPNGPANGCDAPIHTLPVMVTWSRVDHATSYEISFQDDAGARNPLAPTCIGDTQGLIRANSYGVSESNTPLESTEFRDPDPSMASVPRYIKFQVRAIGACNQQSASAEGVVAVPEVSGLPPPGP